MMQRNKGVVILEERGWTFEIITFSRDVSRIANRSRYTLRQALVFPICFQSPDF